MASILSSLRLLADSSRIRLVLLLEQEELSVAELQQILAMGQSRISTHLAQLKQAGLVVDRRVGKNSLYSLQPLDPAVKQVVQAAAAEMPESASDAEALQLTLSKRKDKVRAYFDELAGKFGRQYVPGRSWKALAEMLLELMPPLVVADLGAGEGTVSQLLAQRAERVIAVDNSEKMVEFGAELACRHHVANLEYRLGDLEALPITDASIDLAFFSQSLHHALHPEKALAEAWRIVRPGGRVIILDLLKHNMEEARELYADVWLGFAEVDLRNWLHKAGFAEVRSWIVDSEKQSPYFETLLASGRKENVEEGYRAMAAEQSREAEALE